MIAQVLCEIFSAVLEKTEGGSKTRTRHIREELVKFDWRELLKHAGTIPKATKFRSELALRVITPDGTPSNFKGATPGVVMPNRPLTSIQRNLG